MSASRVTTSTDGVRIDGSPAALEELVWRLGADDDFRARLAATPARVLAAYGIRLPRESPPDQVSLPSKEAVREWYRTIRGGQLALERVRGSARAKFAPLAVR